MIEVFCLDNSELAAFEAINKGYRRDIYVKLLGGFYHLNIYDITRLRQDFEAEVEQDRCYSVDPNLVLVNEVNINEVKNVIDHLYKQKYFDKIKPLEKHKLKHLTLLPYAVVP